MWFYLCGFFLLFIPVFGELVYLTVYRLRKCCRRRVNWTSVESPEVELDQSYTRSVLRGSETKV
jgi:hypothetical protein